MNILFVCTGNTCRSPMAEALAKKILGSEFTVRSAGIAAWEGESASFQALEVMQERDINLRHHAARRVNFELLAWADWVIPMTAEQEGLLKSRYPENSQKITRIASWSDNLARVDITDPWGGPVESYRRCASEIEGLLLEMKTKLKGR